MSVSVIAVELTGNHPSSEDVLVKTKIRRLDCACSQWKHTGKGRIYAHEMHQVSSHVLVRLCNVEIVSVARIAPRTLWLMSEVLECLSKDRRGQDKPTTLAHSMCRMRTRVPVNYTTDED